MAPRRKRNRSCKQQKQLNRENDWELIRKKKRSCKQQKQLNEENYGELIRKRNGSRKQWKQHSEENDGELISVDWTELPPIIFQVIFERLPLIDCISVSDVCKSWRSVFIQDPFSWERHGFPSLFMSNQKDKNKRTCISMIEKRAWEMELPEAHGKYCWGSFHDWLILVKDLECFYLEISLFNPFTRSKIDLPGAWNFYHKMVLSELPSSQKCICMLVHGQSGELAFCVPGAQSWHQYKLVDEPFEDAVFCNGSFYVLSNNYNIWQIDASNVFATISRHDASPVAADSEIKNLFHEVNIAQRHTNDGVLKYLVESCGEVLLVCRFFSTKPDAVLETENFEVYVLDVGQMSWEKINNLGDRVLYLGKCCSRSFSSRELGVNMSNSIYFSNDHVAPWWNEWDSKHLIGISSRLGLKNTDRKDWGIFNLGKEYNGNFCFRGNRDSWAPIWFTAPLWWYCTKFALN
uniref:putative F-box protein At5g55150 n=1 Tax=Ziziphus jujuba TaxID=326968 RepID=A0A6P3ZN69_ZIZJJ